MKKQLHHYFAIATLLFTSLSIQANDEDTSPQLLLKNDKGNQESALLLNTHINGEINGLVASMTIIQEFKNTTDDWVNGRYVFPLPVDAVVDSLTLVNEDRILNGVVKEKQEAKREFEQAKASGKKAGLLEQNRPNLFAMSMANIAPHSKIYAEITWVQKVDYDGGIFSMSLPTTLTPRYIPGKNLQLSLDDLSEDNTDHHIQLQYGWALNTEQVPDASEITPPQVYDAKGMSSHTIDMKLTLNAGLPLDGISSTSHAIDSVQHGQTFEITFKEDNVLMDRDVLLLWQPAPQALPKAAVFTEEKDNAFYHLIMINPPVKNIVSTLAKDVTFIIDTSGSMSGESIRQAQDGLLSALTKLSQNDRFNIIEFNSSSTQLFNDSEMVNEQSLQQARRFVNHLNAGGGTEMMGALKRAFAQAEHEEYLRQIIFITDGAVGNEKNLFSYINQQLGKARLFTVGIGSAPNSHFMQGAAKYGRGTSTRISNLSEVNAKISRLFDKLTYPVMRDIQVKWPDNVTVEAFPGNVPDLYVAEPIMLMARSDKPLNNIELNGHIAEQDWQQSLEIPQGTTAQADNINKIWAIDKVNAFVEKAVLFAEPVTKYKDDIVKIGIENQIVTKFTSFIAVEEEISRPEHLQAKDKQVANLMPKGSTMTPPQTATPASLQMLLGLLLACIAVSKRLARKATLEGVTA